MAKYLIETDQGKFEIETEEPDQAAPDFMPPGETRSFAERAASGVMDTFRGAFGMGAVKSAVEPITEPLRAGADIIRRNPEGAAAAIPAVAATGAGLATGGMGLLPAVAATGAAGFGGKLAEQEVRKRALGLPAVNPQQPTVPFVGIPIPDIPGVPQRLSRATIEAGLQAGPEIVGRGIGRLFSKGGKAAEEAGISGARRAQGFRQSELTGAKGDPFETMRLRGKAARAAKESLERGDIPLSGSPFTMEKNTMKALSEGKSMVDGAIKAAKASGKTLSQETVDSALLKALDPKNADELAAALKIERELADIVESGNVSIDALNNLRQSFGQTGYRDKTVGTAAADMYRKAHSTIGEQIKKLLVDIDPKHASAYKTGLEKEANALTSLRGIEKQIARVEGNEFVSIPGLLTQTVRRAMAPLGVAGFRGGRAAQALAPAAGPAAAAGIRASQTADGGPTDKAPLPPFLETLRNSARRALSVGGSKAQGQLSRIQPSRIPTAEASPVVPAPQALPSEAPSGFYAQAVQSFLVGNKEKAADLAYKAYQQDPANLEAIRLLERLSQQGVGGYKVETRVRRAKK